jgi:tetrahydromethanopterin S-methyltransferase subunit A
MGKKWPVVSGDYKIMEPKSPIALVTLASDKEEYFFDSVAIVGSCKTENQGVERIILNIVSNPSIRFVIVCGKESLGHLSGESLIALHKNGIDKKKRIIGSRGAIPYIENIPPSMVERFRKQTKIFDLRNAPIEVLKKKINILLKEKIEPFGEPMYLEIKEDKKTEIVRERGTILVSSLHLRLNPITGIFSEKTFIDISKSTYLDPITGKIIYGGD